MRGFLIQMREEKRKWSRRQGGREGVKTTGVETDSGLNLMTSIS